MTQIILSWCNFATILLFSLSRSVPELANDIITEIFQYVIFFGYRSFLYLLCGFWIGLSSVFFGVNFARRQLTIGPSRDFTRALQREIKFRGLTRMHRAGLSTDQHIIPLGFGCVYLFLLNATYENEKYPIGKNLLTWVLNFGVKPVHDYVKTRMEKPPDKFIASLFGFALICFVFARFSFTVYGRILGVRFGLITSKQRSEKHKNTRSLLKRRKWISPRRKTQSFGKL